MTFRPLRSSAALAALLPWIVLQAGLGDAMMAQAQEPPASVAAELPEVVISGTKRAQRLATLNGAASVADDGQLDDAGVTDTLQLDRVFPDLQMSYSGSLLYPAITLRGVTSAQDHYNPALTVYVDGVPQLPVFALQSLADVERVELLKGPQGTLYGKSAIGGVLNIVTRQPDDVVRATLRAGLATYGGHRAQAHLAGPLVHDLLYGSVSLTGSRLPGALHSPVLGERLGGVRSQAGNFKLRLAPAGQSWEAGLAGGRDCARGEQDVYVPYDDLASRAAYALDDLPAAHRDVHQRRCVNSLTGHGQYQWDDWQLRAIVSTQRLGIEREYPFGAQYSWQPERWRQNTQELRLSSREPSSGGARHWDAVFGLYRQQVRQSRHYTIDTVVPVVAPFLDSSSRNGSTSVAAYGDATWHLTPELDLSGGLRLSRDSAATRFAGHLMGATVAGAESTRQNTWLARVAAGYQFSPQWRGYVNVAQGYKPAGYNLAPTSMADAEGFGRERATSYEVGLRHAGKTLRASVAAYVIGTRDVQLYGDSDMGYQTLKNVGNVRSSGLEFDIEWDATRSWTLQATGFVNRARFRRYTDSSACTDCSGNHLPLAPRHGLTLAANGHLRVGSTVLRPRLALRHLGAHYFDTANQLRQGGYTLIDAGLSWFPQDNLELALYVNNLTDKAYRGYGFSRGPEGNFAQLGARRTVGLTLTYAY